MAQQFPEDTGGNTVAYFDTLFFPFMVHQSHLLQIPAEEVEGTGANQCVLSRSRDAGLTTVSRESASSTGKGRVRDC